MATPPARTDLANTYPNPSNAQFRTGIGQLWDWLTERLGVGNSLADARTALGIGNVISERNLLINAAGWFNQRGYVSGTATTAANAYTIDRWRVVVSGQSLVFGAASPDRTLTAPAGGIEQPIAGNLIEGGVYTLSWQGSATATVNGTPIANGGNTASLPANTNVLVRFIGGTVLLPQFEKGTVATPFQRRIRRQELLLAREYCRALPVGAIDHISSNANAGQNNSYPVPLGEPMREGATVQFSTSWTLVNVGTITVSVTSPYNVVLNVPNLAAGQWRITNATIAVLEAEIP